MGTINPTVARVNDNTVKFTYAGMTFTGLDVGAPIGPNHADYTDRNVQVLGTFGVGGSLSIQGSNDGGSNYIVLNDQSDQASTFTAAKADQIMEIPELTRPAVTAGDGTTSLTCIIIARRPVPPR
jgi:hypothetical protein